MSWAEILKAQFLPGNNARRWVQILGSEQEFQKFLKILESGDFKQEGKVKTLRFIEQDNFDKLISEIFNKGVDEDDAEARYQTLKVLIPKNIEEDKRGGRQPVNFEEFNSTLNAIQNAIKGNRPAKLPQLFKTAEIFARQHPKVIEGKKGQVRNDYGVVIGGYLASKNPLSTDEFGNRVIDSSHFKELTGLRTLREMKERKVKVPEAKEGEEQLTASQHPEVLAIKDDYVLLRVFALRGKQKKLANVRQKDFRAKKDKLNPIAIDFDEAQRYFKEQAVKHRVLVPDAFLPRGKGEQRGGLMEPTGKGYKLNPYFDMMLQYDNLGDVEKNLNYSLQEKLGGGDTLERLLQHHDRVYTNEFAEWLTDRDEEGNSMIKFEDGKIIEGEDAGGVTFTEDEQKLLQRITDARFNKIDDKFSYANASDKVLSLIERVWDDTTGASELADELDFDDVLEVNEVRQSMGDFNSVMANYKEQPISGQFGRNSQELLDALVAGADALELPVGEPSRDMFFDLFQDFKQGLATAVTEKLDDIRNNQFKYSEFNVGKGKKEQSIAESLKEGGFFT